MSSKINFLYIKDITSAITDTVVCKLQHKHSNKIIISDVLRQSLDGPRGPAIRFICQTVLKDRHADKFTFTIDLIQT